MKALESLNKKDMTEIKSYGHPPALVETVMQAVMILLGRDPTWAEAKRQLGKKPKQKDVDVCLVAVRRAQSNHSSVKFLGKHFCFCESRLKANDGLCNQFSNCSWQETPILSKR